MDPLSAGSGIVGLIAISVKVIQLIAEFTILAGEQKNHAETLHTEILLLNQVLGQLKGLIDEGQRHGRLTLIDDTDENTVLGKAFADCSKLMQQISQTLKEPVTKFQRAMAKLKWPFEQKEVFRTVQSLHRYTQLFQFSLNITNCELFSKTFDLANDGLRLQQENCKKIQELSAGMPDLAKNAEESLQQTETLLELVPSLLREVSIDIREIEQTQMLAEQREQERRTTDILDWLCPLSTLQKHSDLRARRAKGTGQWFLAKDEVLSWMKVGSESHDFLCLGDPGVGKTNLASSVIDRLSTMYHDADIAIVHLYCDYREQQAQTPQSCARSILRQLSMQISTSVLPASISEFYQNTRNDVKDQSWYLQLQALICRIATTFTKCFFVIDALDETEPNYQRRGLLDLFKTIQYGLPYQRPKIFATSRKHASSVLSFFQDACKVTVTANVDDLRNILSKIITEHHDSKYIVDEPLREEILSKLCLGSDGMFLLPILQMQEILSQLTKSEVRRALRELSVNLSQAFESTIGRILNLPQDKRHAMNRRKLAAKALMWISHAKRVLTVSELQHALAIREDDVELDQENMLDPQLIIDSCFGLLEIDKESSTIRFVHYSLQEYLKSHDHGLFDNGDVEVTRTCLKYLSLARVKELHAKNRPSFIRALDELLFLDYCAKEWGYHAADVESDTIKDLALPFLKSNSLLLSAARIRDRDSPVFRKWHERMYAWAFSDGAGISTCASFGLTDLLKVLVGAEPQPMLKAKNMFGKTALHEAALKGYDSTVSFLLEKGADVLDQDHGQNTPLYLAVGNGNLSTVNILLRNDAASQLQITGRQSRTVLQLAADLGNEEMVIALLQKGAAAHAWDEKGVSPLHVAARKGSSEIVRLLIMAGAPVNRRSHDRQTACDWAVTAGHLDVTKFFLENGVSATQRSPDRWTLINRAARNGHLDIVKLLLANGADIKLENHKGETALHAACRGGKIEVVQALLSYQPESVNELLSIKDRKGSTARDIAFFTAHFDIYKLLRAAEMETQPQPQTPSAKISHAIENGKLEKLRRLLAEHSPDLDASIDDRQPALHLAMQEEQPAIINLLLDAGASINSIGYHGWRPIHIAAAIGNMPLTQLCLVRDADIHARTDTNQSVLHKACSSGSVDTVRLLLHAGADPETTNSRGMTPLMVSAHENELAMVRLLAEEWRVEVRTRDNMGDTAVDWAERRGHLEVIRCLRGEEKRRRQGEEKREVRGLVVG